MGRRIAVGVVVPQLLVLVPPQLRRRSRRGGRGRGGREAESCTLSTLSTTEAPSDPRPLTPDPGGDGGGVLDGEGTPGGPLQLAPSRCVGGCSRRVVAQEGVAGAGAVRPARAAALRLARVAEDGEEAAVVADAELPRRAQGQGVQGYTKKTHVLADH